MVSRLYFTFWRPEKTGLRVLSDFATYPKSGVDVITHVQSECRGRMAQNGAQIRLARLEPDDLQGLGRVSDQNRRVSGATFGRSPRRFTAGDLFDGGYDFKDRVPYACAQVQR